MANAIMIQGTASNAGKSLLAAGLCRIFAQDGYKVAPFKSQNMALNSFITREGLEMGRAQVMQAEAAGVEPSVRMNPVLLKPTSDVGSQVIVNGEVVGSMSAAAYLSYKKQLIPTILESYHALAQTHDIVVLEGAGSPAEINLKAEDIVNMGMARMAGAPVLLAGDIDRGGVFAALYGTMALLEPDERAMVKGTIINKFRGDVEILRPGLTQLEELTHVPVVGVVPWMELDLDEEDSLSQHFSARREGKPLDVAVIRLPRISNFTDFAPLERHPAVGLRYVDRVQALGRPDLVILPGTKSTLADLSWLRQSGLEGTILRLVGKGVPVIGICGGFQMLGRTLEDPQGVEGGGSMHGMGLLPVATTFSRKKSREQKYCQADLPDGFYGRLRGCPLEGYEIHMGESILKDNAGTATRITDSVSGKKKEEGAFAGNVCGTYIHGVFDKEASAEAIIRVIGEKKGIDVENMTGVDFAAFKEQQYDILAAELRKHLDMKKIYEILENGITEEE
mgnify:FL=1